MNATTALAVDIRDALTATILSAGRDDTVPILQAVKLDKVGDQLIFTSTDRYRLTQVAITLQDSNGDDFSALLPLDVAKRFVTSLPKRTARENMIPASFKVNGKIVQLIMFDGTTLADNQPGDYPKLESIIRPHLSSQVVGITRVSFNPAYMVDLCKMPGRGKNDPVTLHLNAAEKPIRCSWSSGAVSYSHLIMSVTVSDVI